MDSIELGSNSQPASQPANHQQHQPSNHLRKNVGNCSSLCIYIMTESVRVFGMCPRPRHTQNLLHCRTSSEIGPGLLLFVFPRCVSKIIMTPSKFNLHSSIAWFKVARRVGFAFFSRLLFCLQRVLEVVESALKKNMTGPRG